MERLKIGDFVQVIAGKDKGKRGKIAKLNRADERVVVEGLNMVMKHMRPNQLNTEGGRIPMEAPLHMSNVMLIDAVSDAPTRVKIQKAADGAKARVSVKGNPLKQG